MESAESATQQLTDIQNYLAKFNKEIQQPATTAQLATQPGQTIGLIAEKQNITYLDIPTTSTEQITMLPGVEHNLQLSLEDQQVIEAAAASQPEGTVIQVIQEGDESGMRLQGKHLVKGTTEEGQTAIYVCDAQDLISATAAGDGKLIGEQQQDKANVQIIHAMADEGAVATAVTLENQHELMQSLQSSAVQVIQPHDMVTSASTVVMQPQSALETADASNFQTVSVMPNEHNPDDVSYVLVVSQPEDGQGEAKAISLDSSVYDFKESGMQQTGITSDGRRIFKFNAKKFLTPVLDQSHMCSYCNYTSHKRYLLHRHMKSHSEDRPHRCNVCERGFKTLASLQNHLNTHTGTRPHKCRDCESAFTTSGELVRHMRYKHTHEKPHKCTECEYSSVELSKLKRHMRCHTGERPYQCPHCTYASPDTFKLKRHLRVHTGEKPYECDICQARFTQSNSLKSHRLIHLGNKPVFQCELCPTTCGRKTDLRIHVQKLHTSDKPLRCKKCGKHFPDRYTFKIHSKTHDGEKCFKCDLCNYASLTQRHLEAHMLVHTDRKPFHCDECDQSFRQKQLLRRHKNLYHDPSYIAPLPKEKEHECSECHKFFRHKGNLSRHLLVHDPNTSAARIEEINEVVDAEENYLDEQNMELLHVPEDGHQVILINVANAVAANDAAEAQAVAEASGDALAESETAQLIDMKLGSNLMGTAVVRTSSGQELQIQLNPDDTKRLQHAQANSAIMEEAHFDAPLQMEVEENVREENNVDQELSEEAAGELRNSDVPSVKQEKMNTKEAIDSCFGFEEEDQESKQQAAETPTSASQDSIPDTKIAMFLSESVPSG